MIDIGAHAALEPLSDVDEQARRLIGYDRRYQQQGKGEFRGRFAARHLSGHVSVFLEWCNLRLFQRACVPRETCSLHFFLSAKSDCILNGQCLTEDSVVLLPGGASFDHTSCPDTWTCVIRLAASLFSDVIPADLTCGIFADDPRFGDRFRTLARRALFGAAANPDASIGANDSRLAEEICDIARQFVIAYRLSTPQKRAERAIYKKALAVIDSKLGGPIRIADLCRSVGASRRMLENAFVANMGHGPAAYIRLARLNGVRRRIRSEDDRHRTIGDIAAQVGIWHLGRLSRDFRVLFGVSPHQLRQRTKDA